MCGSVGVLLFLGFLAVPTMCAQFAQGARQYQVVAEAVLSAHCRGRRWLKRTTFSLGLAASVPRAPSGQNPSSPRRSPPPRRQAGGGAATAPSGGGAGPPVGGGRGA